MYSGVPSDDIRREMKSHGWTLRTTEHVVVEDHFKWTSSSFSYDLFDDYYSDDDPDDVILMMSS